MRRARIALILTAVIIPVSVATFITSAVSIALNSDISKANAFAVKLQTELGPKPPAGTPIFHTLSYYMHAGGHGTIPSDWDQYLKFLQMHLHPLSQ